MAPSPGNSLISQASVSPLKNKRMGPELHVFPGKGHTPFTVHLKLPGDPLSEGMSLLGGCITGILRHTQGSSGGFSPSEFPGQNGVSNLGIKPRYTQRSVKFVLAHPSPELKRINLGKPFVLQLALCGSSISSAASTPPPSLTPSAGHPHKCPKTLLLPHSHPSQSCIRTALLPPPLPERPGLKI